MTTVEQQVREIMATVFDVAIESVHENTSTDTLDQWDSLTHLTLITALEETFQIQFTIEDMETMTDYAQIIQKVKQLHS